MYVLCNPIWTLAEAAFYRASFIDSVLHFNRRWPDVKTILVFKDVRGHGNPKDFQFVQLLNSKQIHSLVSKYQVSPGKIRGPGVNVD